MAVISWAVRAAREFIHSNFSGETEKKKAIINDFILAAGFMSNLRVSNKYKTSKVISKLPCEALLSTLLLHRQE